MDRLGLAEALLKEYPAVYVHTHLAENEEEVAQVARQFPRSGSYLDVYERFGLVRERSVFAHCIHMEDDDRNLMARKGTAMAFCPSSNLFLGSGLFDLQAARQCGVLVGAGSDVGGGTSLNMLRNMGDAYKVLQLKQQSLTPFGALYLMTLGSAEALRLNERIGSFANGKDADFIVINVAGTTIRKRRWDPTEYIAAKLFLQFTLCDDCIVSDTYLGGQRAEYRMIR